MANYNAASQNNINGLEGVVTTSLAHSIGPRRWFSGITGNDHGGAGTDTKTYSNNGEIGKHFYAFVIFCAW